MTPYVEQVWVDDDGTGTVGTPFTADRMNYIEDGIGSVDERVDTIELTPGPEGPAGPAGINPRGYWDGANSYAVDDVVTYNGSAYIATWDHPAGDPDPFNGGGWSQFVAQGDQGPRGPEGPQGPQGLQGFEGPRGFTGPEGPPGVNWRGDWAANVVYAVREAVAYNGSSYYVFSGPVPAGTPPTEAAYWNVLAAKGGTGDAGPAGPQGAEGPQGIPGPLGPEGPQGDVGPVGPPGDTGPQGPAGERWFMSAGLPSGDAFPLGAVIGDWYLDNATGNVWEKVGADVTPSAWLNRGNLKGPKGDTGPVGPQGPALPALETPTPASFAANWTNYSTNVVGGQDWGSVSSWKDQLGIVHISGLARRINTAFVFPTTVMTLPVAHRSTKIHAFACYSIDGVPNRSTMRVVVGLDGTVVLADSAGLANGAAGTVVHLEGISFRQDF